MGYRDERDGLQLRVTELEEELSHARETIARLQGEAAVEGAERGKPGWFTGAPSRATWVREVPHELTEEGYEALAELLTNRVASTGQVSQVGRTLTFRSGDIEARVTRNGPGRTELRLTRDYQAYGVLLGIGVLGTSLFGALPALVAVLKATGFTPAALLVTLPLAVIACWRALRALTQRSIDKEGERLAGVFEAMTDLCARHARPSASAQGGARIDTSDAPAEQEAAEREAAEVEALVDGQSATV